jgi:hypothetical protein
MATMATESDSLLGSNGSKDKAGSNTAGIRLVFAILLSLLIGIGVGVIGTLKTESYTTSDDIKIQRDSPYSATQFISFSINTLGGMDKYGECEGRSVDPADGLCYLGNADDLVEDLDHRFRIVFEVLQALKEDKLNEYPEVDHSPNVLKIFMLPEFYLRGPNGAYSTKQLKEDGLLLEVADKVHDIIADEAFENYLFVFGTVIAADSPHDSSTPWNHPGQDIEKGDILFFNFAPIYRGGPEEEGKSKRFLVPKKYISTADFLNRSNGLPNPRRSHLSEYDDLDMDQEMFDFLVQKRNVTIVEHNVLEIDGIRIGIELCLDHRLGVLWDTLQRRGEDLVDVQLITSAGMAIERGPTPLRPGGVAYLTDGEASSAACQRTDHGAFDPLAVCRDIHNDGPTGLKHVPNGGSGYSSYIELATCLNPDDAPWKPLLQGYYSNHATQGCAYTLKVHGIDVFDEYDFYPPSIEIYPTIDLP